MTISLEQWEHSLQASILDRYDAMGEMIKPSPVARQTRLEVYQNAYLLRLAEALQVNFICLYQLLGENDFGRMMLKYLEYQNPIHPSIRWFGDHLSTFLKCHPDYRDRPWLSEIASFEWALIHTVDAASAIRSRFEDLANLRPDGWLSLYIGLHPSVSILPLEWAIPECYQAAVRGETVIPPDPQRLTWLIYRGVGGDGLWRSLDTLETCTLRAIQSGISFVDLCGAMASDQMTLEAASTCVGEFLRSWVEEGLIIQIAPT